MDKKKLDINNDNIFNNLHEIKNKLDCLLFLSPSIIESYYDMKELTFDKYNLPSVPNICENQKNYRISKLNISLFLKENLQISFLKNNGLHLIYLEYEYLYQLSIHLSKSLKQNNNKENKLIIEDDIKKIINNILNNSIEILINNRN